MVQFLVDGRDQRGFVPVRTVPFAVRLEPYEEFIVEEAGGIRSVIRPSEL